MKATVTEKFHVEPSMTQEVRWLNFLMQPIEDVEDIEHVFVNCHV